MYYVSLPTGIWQIWCWNSIHNCSGRLLKTMKKKSKTTNFFFDLKIKVVPESAITLFSLEYVRACTHKHTPEFPWRVSRQQLHWLTKKLSSQTLIYLMATQLLPLLFLCFLSRVPFLPFFYSRFRQADKVTQRRSCCPSRCWITAILSIRCSLSRWQRAALRRSIRAPFRNY